MADADVVTTVLDELEANRAMFEALCVSCRPDWLARPVPGGHWTVQDHIAHVASFDALAIGLLGGRRPDAGPGMPDGDRWNEAQIARRAGRTLTMLLEEMESLRERSSVALQGEDAASLAREVWFAGEQRRPAGLIPLRWWVERWSRHDMIHARWMLDALPEIAASSDFQSWLADDPLLEALAREEGRQA